MGNVTVRDSGGRAYDVPEEQLPGYLSHGFTVETPAERAQPAIDAAREDRFGGEVPAAALSATTGALGTVTGGLSDAAFSAIGGSEGLREVQDLHPIAHGLGALGAAFVPVGLPGLAGKAGAAIRAGSEGAGLVGGIARAGLAGATEGALYGAGQGVSELALSQDPLTLEHAAAAIGSNALYGAGAGAVAGGVLKGVEHGLGAAKRALDRALLARSEARAMGAVGELEAEAAAHPPTIGSDTDVTALDKAGLKTAREQEIEALHTAQVPERQAFVDELRASRAASEQEKTWIATQNGKTREVRSLGRETLDADRRVDGLLKVERDLVDKPQRALSALRQQEQALSKLQTWGERETQRYVDEVASARDQIRADLLANKVDGYIFGKGGISRTSSVVDDIADGIFKERYPDPNRLPTNLQVLNAVPGALERNKSLQDRLARLAEAPTSPRLSAIGTAEEALGARTAPPAPEPTASPIGSVLKMAAHAVPFGGLAEKAAGALGGLRKAIGAGTERVQQAASTFLGKAAPVAGKAASIAPPVATKVLAALRYGEPETDERGRRVATPEPKTLPELYRARTDEIKSQVQLAPDGTYQMRPAARAKMAARLSGLGAVDPIAADRMESAGAARIAWLASQMPQRPDLAGLPVGPDTWNPSDAAMRGWTRKAAAAEDPYGVLERASAGAKARVVPEEVMALRALQPALLDDYVTQIIAGLSERKTRLPYPQRLALSMLTGRPLDPAMTPSVLRELQSMHAGEPGTAGGTMAPRSKAQFGSVKRSDPGTPAQRRQGVGL